jgi:hypothetical protein
MHKKETKYREDLPAQDRTQVTAKNILSGRITNKTPGT